MNKKPANVAASVHQQLLNLAHKRYENFNLVLTRYGLERLLYRLGRSEHADRFVLKGAMLFAAWTEQIHRPTRDLDFLGLGEASPEALKNVFEQVCQVEVEPDGLEFDPSSVQVEEIREAQEYPGLRVRLMGHLGQARVPLQVDVGFGDAITPAAKEIEYPTLLDLPRPRIWAYPKESMVSEKLEAMVVLGMANSRMKDFYDLWVLSMRFSFDGRTLVQAIQATFERRRTLIPDGAPTGLSAAFAADTDHSKQWRAFLDKNGFGDKETTLSDVIQELQTFLLPPLEAAVQKDPFPLYWKAGGPWSQKSKERA